jgi:hypothetical protein
MKQPTFFEGVVVAIVASVSGSAIALVLTPLFGRGGMAQLLITGISFTYLIYLLARSPERVGRITTVMLWIGITAIAWFAGLPVLLLGLVQVAFLWLIRSLYFYSSVLSALMDLGLTVLSLVVAFWAGTHSSSLFLGLWSFFLMQALFVVIPRQIRRGNNINQLPQIQDDRFQNAYRSAQAAVRKLSTVK